MLIFGLNRARIIYPKKIRIAAAVLLCGLSILSLSFTNVSAQTHAQTSPPATLAPLPRSAPFASELYTFSIQDQFAPITACRSVFVGSSSIRFWLSLRDDFPALNPLNRGFGGSEISHIITYFDRLLTPHQPQEIILYAGENDLNAGRTPSEVLDRLRVFLRLKTERLGDTPVYFLSVKPSPARWHAYPTQIEFNRRVADFAETRNDLIFVDIVNIMLNDGRPKPIFISDQLHMNAKGYALWTQILSPFLSAPDRPVASHCQ